MTQIVSTRRRCASNRGQGAPIHPQGIAHTVQTDRMCQPGKNQGCDMTPRRKRPTFFIHAIFVGQLVYKMWRNKIANLLEHRVLFHHWNDPPSVFTSPSLFHDGWIIPAFHFLWDDSEN